MQIILDISDEELTYLSVSERATKVIAEITNKHNIDMVFEVIDYINLIGKERNPLRLGWKYVFEYNIIKTELYTELQSAQEKVKNWIMKKYNMPIYTFDPKKNKNVVAGLYEADSGMFIKKVNKHHYMILEKGYGLSEEVVQQLIALDCKKIRIITEKQKMVYEFNFDCILIKPIKNYGHGNQRFLQICG